MSGRATIVSGRELVWQASFTSAGSGGVPLSVFLSHSSKDKAFVRRLTADLQQEGITVWLDEVELRPGESLAAIEASIRTAQYVIVVLSQTAAGSSWIEREVQLAEDAGITVLPLILEELPLSWDDGLPERAIADFRVGEYRHNLARLLCAIKDLPPPRFLTAKQAAQAVKAKTPVTGELFGLSQQGVGTLYCMANRQDWRFADASGGRSRLWVAQFFDPRNQTVHPYVVMDGKIHPDPVLYLLDSDPGPVAGSTTVMSTTLNERLEISEDKAKASVAKQRGKLTTITKRYTRFRPIVITRPFIDSDEAVAAAVSSPPARREVEQHEAVLTMATLECDKRLNHALLWKVSFFDVALSEAVLTVGIDARDGAVRYPAVRSEVLNANLLQMSLHEDGKLQLSMANQISLLNSRVWDIAAPGEIPSQRPTAADALRRTSALLAGEASRWQLAFLSNTGVVEPVRTPGMTAYDFLTRIDGTAGQWVVELCSIRSTPVTEGDRSGFEYSFRQVVVSRDKPAELVAPSRPLRLTAGLFASPLPDQLMAGYDAARVLAQRMCAEDFDVFAVALERPSGAPRWLFRFYGDRALVAQIRVSIDGSAILEARDQNASGAAKQAPDNASLIGDQEQAVAKLTELLHRIDLDAIVQHKSDSAKASVDTDEYEGLITHLRESDDGAALLLLAASHTSERRFARALAATDAALQLREIRALQRAHQLLAARRKLEQAAWRGWSDRTRERYLQLRLQQHLHGAERARLLTALGRQSVLGNNARQAEDCLRQLARIDRARLSSGIVRDMALIREEIAESRWWRRARRNWIRSIKNLLRGNRDDDGQANPHI